MKTCTKCGKSQTLDNFYVRRERKNGRRATCKACISVANKGRWRAGTSRPTPEKQRRANLRRYGITPEDFDRMLQAQGGVCAVCQGPPMGKGQYHVDHCHQTGRVRGLLCHKCNVALGMVQDKVEHLHKLIEYLELT